MPEKKFNVAVVGATGTVGTTICQILESRNFPIKQLDLLASEKSKGEKISVSDNTYTVKDIAEYDFKNTDIALFSAGSEVSKRFVPVATKAGTVVIDNTSFYRQDKDVPLVVTEINSNKISGFNKKNIIANPNCSTMQMLVALKPLYDAAKIKRINVATYQSVSGSGRAAIDELADQTKALLSAENADNIIYPKQIAFNVIPHIDTLQENGYTKEEMKMVWETKKILEDDLISVNATAVRVPVFFGHSEAVHIETEKKLSAKDAISILQQAPGIKLIKQDNKFEYPTPRFEGNGTDEVFVGRVREDISHYNGLNLWIVADNVRKGAALNAVQIAEILAKKYL